MVAVGKGTRLLCVEDTFNLVKNTTYTCRAIITREELNLLANSFGYEESYCTPHANTCGADGVQLEELNCPISDNETGELLSLDGWFCLACFKPLGGDLPSVFKEMLITKPADVVKPKILEPA